MINEMWKPIPGYLNYKVSSFGRVKSIDRVDTLGRMWEGRVLKPGKTQRGYPFVNLFEDGMHKNYMVHRLVMAAFVGPCPEGMEVNHIDEDKTNNRLDNLEYVTHKQNINHGDAIERIKQHSRKKAVVSIDDFGNKEYFESQMDAERKTGVWHTNISKCCKGKQNKAGGYAWRYA